MLKKAELTKEISVIVDNEVGVLDKMSGYLADRGINIEAVAAYEMEGAKKSEIMLVVDDTRRAHDVLREKEYEPIKEREIILVELDNKPGALKTVATLLAHKEINIRYIYGTASPEAAPVRIVLSTSDNEKAYIALKKSGIK